MAGMNVRDDVLSKVEKSKPSGRDLAYRAVAAVLGGPVDLTSMVMKPFGYNVEQPVLGSEWIGQQMQDVGLVSEARDPMQEFMASLLVPGGGIEAVPALAGKGMAMLPAMAGVVKGKGGNWLTGSVENALRPLKNPYVDKFDQAVANYGEKAHQYVADPGNNARALNAWVEGPLTKYVKTRMASPDDEIRKLADQGVLHAELQPNAYQAEASRKTADSMVRTPRLDSPGRVMSTTPLGKSWEDAADASLSVWPINTPGEAKTAASLMGFPEGKLPELGSVTYSPASFGNMAGDSLGFRHLTDELSNALNPESGLPRALQLTPDQMKNLSVEKAVRRVADINKWRANQMAEANKAIAFDEKTAPIFKEYQTVPGYGGGQPNEKGLHWREIKKGEDVLPEWAKVIPHRDPGNPMGRKVEILDAMGRTVSEGVDEADAISRLYSTDKRMKSTGAAALEKQLKYEGDTMGHCVGGYCDAVLSGRSQVYTLRDKAGKPHVTIETSPGRVTRDYLEQFPDPDNPDKFTKNSFGDNSTFRDYVQRHRSGNGDMESFAIKALREHGHDLPPPTIVQIKGAKNSMPKDEYVPFIQDFIRSGKFSDVGDLQNAQLKKASNTFNKTELAYLERHGAKLTGEEYLTEAEVAALQSLFKPTN